MPYWYIPIGIFSPLFFSTKKALGFPCVLGPPTKTNQRSVPQLPRAVPCPTCASFEADNLKFLDSIKVFDGLNQKQKDTDDTTRRQLKKPPVVDVTVVFHVCFLFFPTKKGVEVFFLGGKSRWMKSIEAFEKVQDAICWGQKEVSRYMIFICIWLNCINFTLSRFLRPAMLTYLCGWSSD